VLRVVRLDERPDGVQVTFHDAEVTRVVLTERVAFEATDRDRDTLRISLSTPFEVRHGRTETWALDPERDDDERLGRLAFALRHGWVITCAAASDGTLTVQLEGGMAIVAPPDPDDEAWELAHERFQVVALAGGGLATWDAERGDRPERA
jgi:hypothetical protein